MSPPWALAMSRAIANPRPDPPSSWLRASSRRKNGLKTSSRIRGSNSRSVIVYVNDQPARFVICQDFDALAVAGCICHKVDHEPAESIRPHRDHRIAHHVENRRVALSLGIGLQLLQKRTQIRLDRLLAEVAASKGEIALEHARHLVGVALEIFYLGGLRDQRQRELEPGENCAQVVTDAVEHGGALLEIALDAPLHFEERMTGLAHLARALGVETRSHALFQAPRQPPTIAGSA